MNNHEGAIFTKGICTFIQDTREPSPTCPTRTQGKEVVCGSEEGLARQQTMADFQSSEGRETFYWHDTSHMIVVAAAAD